jgi:hypothetical protein
VQYPIHCQAPCQYVGCDSALNSALAFIEGFAPRNEVEAAVALQMACTHSAAMSVLARLGPATGTEDHVCRFASAAARLLRAFTMQLEAYRRLRHGGDQHVRVEHVHINQGAQAVIGNVHPQESGRAQTPETQMRRDPDEGAA